MTLSSWRKNFHNETKILSEQVAPLNNSIFEISNKFEILQHDKTNKENILIETKLKQKAESIKPESSQMSVKIKTQTDPELEATSFISSVSILNMRVATKIFFRRTSTPSMPENTKTV